MFNDLYFIPLIRAFILTALLTGTFVFLSSRCKRIEKNRQTDRHVHLSSVSRWGGLAIISGFWLSIFSDSNLVISQELWGVLIASLLILIFGIVDDLRELSWKKQLLFQIFIALLIFVWGIRILSVTNPFGGSISLGESYWLFSLLFGLAWIALNINSMNWLDGVDGLSGGVTIIGSITLFLISIRPEVNQPPMGIISLSLAGAAAGFLLFNFHPGKIMAGTSGSMFMGLMLGVLAIFAGAKVATAFLVMAIPIGDFFWVIFKRWRLGLPIVNPDQRHLHFRLLDLGWSQRKISLVLCFFTFGIGMVALNTHLVEKLVSIVLVFLALLIIFFALERKLKK
jgi:UDP-GlcNAc:undecaprenyl-phosphate GlcNAc-1-phosphate transferase